MKFINRPKRLVVPQKDKIIFLDWPLIEKAIFLFNRQIKNLPKFDTIFVLVRGGMVPATMLSHRLKIRKLVFYQGIKTCSNKPHDYGDFYCDSLPKLVPGGKYLIVEDIIFEGDTVNSAVDYIKESGGSCVGICSLVIDENLRIIQAGSANSIPLICAYECENLKWIRFPWELKLQAEKNPSI